MKYKFEKDLLYRANNYDQKANNTRNNIARRSKSADITSKYASYSTTNRGQFTLPSLFNFDITCISNSSEDGFYPNTPIKPNLEPQPPAYSSYMPWNLCNDGLHTPNSYVTSMNNLTQMDNLRTDKLPGESPLDNYKVNTYLNKPDLMAPTSNIAPDSFRNNWNNSVIPLVNNPGYMNSGASDDSGPKYSSTNDCKYSNIEERRLNYLNSLSNTSKPQSIYNSINFMVLNVKLITIDQEDKISDNSEESVESIGHTLGIRNTYFKETIINSANSSKSSLDSLAVVNIIGLLDKLPYQCNKDNNLGNVDTQQEFSSVVYLINNVNTFVENKMILTNLCSSFSMTLLNSYKLFVLEHLIKILPTNVIVSVFLSSLTPECFFQLIAHSVHGYAILCAIIQHHTPALGHIMDLLCYHRQCVDIAVTQRGCYTLKLLLTKLDPDNRSYLVHHLLPFIGKLCYHKYGNYLVQAIIKTEDKEELGVHIWQLLRGKFAKVSCNKYGSNVIECLIRNGSISLQNLLNEELVCMPSNLKILTHHAYGNFVVQTIIDELRHKPMQYVLFIVDHIKPMLLHSPYRKKLETRINRLISKPLYRP